MSREQKIKEGQILLNDLDNYRPLDKPMADETDEKIKQLTTSMLTEGHIDEMTIKWLSQIPNPPRIPEFYTLTKIHRPKLVGRPIIGTFRSDYEYEYEFFNVYPVRMPDCVWLSRQLVLSSKSRRVAVLTPTTRFSTILVPRLRVHYRCKGELKG